MSALFFVLFAAAAPAPSNGAVLYKRCAACHLPTGAGIPGAFPPLGLDVQSLARTVQGRRYLALVVIRGVAGPIIVEGKSYRGVMPAQSGLLDAEVASVLNYVLGLSQGSAKPFTAAEVAQARKGGAALTAAEVAKLHPGVRKR